MPLTIADAIVYSNTGGVATSDTSTAITVSLAGADETEDGDAVIVFLSGYAAPTANGLQITVPSGWRFVFNQASAGFAILYRTSLDGLVAGESSWGFTPSAVAAGSNPVTWSVLVLNGIDAENPVDVPWAGSFDPGTGTVRTTSNSTRTTVYDGMFFGVHIFRDADNATPATWASHTNSFTEVVESGRGTGSVSTGMSVSALPTTVINTYTVGATAVRSFAANETYAGSFSLMAQGAAREIDLVQMDGGESYQVGTITGSVTLDAAAARSGAVGYLLNSTAAACSKALTVVAPGTVGTYPTFRWCFRVPDLTDRAQIAYFTITVSGGTAKVLTLRMTSGLLGLVWSGGLTPGSEQFSDQAITANQWVGIDLRIDRRTALAYTVEWAVDYNAELTDTTPGVRQTAVTATAATGSFVSLAGRIGWSSTLTSTMHMDDYGTAPGHNFPIGDLRVLPLKVDSSATPTVTGATTNFGVMTANGTVAAWNATNARNAVDDIPPIAAGSGSRDAAVCLLAHATDTANFPMETVDLAASKVNVRGAKSHWWLWAASATTATIRIFVSDGTTTYTVYAEADPNADNVTQLYDSSVLRASTAPAWSQAKVNALEFRFGSNDATPDIGLDAMLIELAVVKAVPEALFGEAGAPVYVEAHRDPATQALVGASVTTDADNAVELTWEVSGVPDTSGVIPPSTTSQYVPMSADGTIETVNTVSLIPG